MIFKMFNEFHRDVDSTPSKYEVQRYYNKFGIVYLGNPREPKDGTAAKTFYPIRWIIRPGYDNIFRFSQDVFVLWGGHRVGAVRCVDDAEDMTEWIALCEYDAVGINNQDLIFFKPGERKYYFHSTHTTRIFCKVDIVESSGRYIFGIDTSAYYIIDSRFNFVLWSCPRSSSCLSPWSLFSDEPSLAYRGETNGLPIFFDTKNEVYIAPTGNGKLDFMRDIPCVFEPINVQGENVVNIFEDDSLKIYAGTYDECIHRCFDEDEGFDRATVELKVTLSSQNRIQERYYPIPQGTFVIEDSGFLGIID